MLPHDAPEILNLILAGVIAYIFGALPLADRVSRRRGVDVFSSGTGLAGATNVRRNVGFIPASLVVLGEGNSRDTNCPGARCEWTLDRDSCCCCHHWSLEFSVHGLPGWRRARHPWGSYFGGFPNLPRVLGDHHRCPYSSLFCIIAGYGVIILLFMQNRVEDLDTAFAMGALALVVLGHALVGHAKRRRSTDDVAGDFVDNR